MRGKAIKVIGPLLPCGITPACAGKSTTAGRGRMLFRDHPRVCGEKTTAEPVVDLSSGSPPRVRGKGIGKHSYRLEVRITPACAGKRLAFRTIFLMSQDHPRVCGEKQRQSQFNSGSMGSPPRVRGKVKQALKACARHGITPACAGKRFRRRLSDDCTWDHPRVCGEKCWPLVWIIWLTGSPPRVRGKGGASWSSWPPAGITPACAGKRATAGTPARRRRDHPRVCGEK